MALTLPNHPPGDRMNDRKIEALTKGFLAVRGSEADIPCIVEEHLDNP